MQVFGSQYSAMYDALYAEKNYEAECDLIEEVFSRFGVGDTDRLLDLGCGTGSHLLPLLARGYSVVGVDRSRAMIDLLLQKASEAGLEPHVEQCSIEQFETEATFDAVLLMFAVLGYQLTNEKVLETLRVANVHLRPGGLLVFDVWFGPAVLVQRPSDRVKVVHGEEETVIRASRGELRPSAQTVAVDMEVWRIQGERVVAHAKEEHEMRFFFPKELELLLSVTGFSLLRIGAFEEPNEDPDENTWNVLVVARRDGASADSGS